MKGENKMYSPENDNSFHELVQQELEAQNPINIATPHEREIGRQIL